MSRRSISARRALIWLFNVGGLCGHAQRRLPSRPPGPPVEPSRPTNQSGSLANHPSGPANRPWSATNQSSVPANRRSTYCVPNTAFSTNHIVGTRGAAWAAVAVEEVEMPPEAWHPHSAWAAELEAADLAALEGLVAALEGLAPLHTIHIHTLHTLHSLRSLRILRTLHTQPRDGPGPRGNILFVNPERA